MTNTGMIYKLNREEAEREVERIRADLTPEQIEAHRRISEQSIDEEDRQIIHLCILDRVSKVDNCFYSMEAYKAIEAACHDAYMMGKASEVK